MIRTYRLLPMLLAVGLLLPLLYTPASLAAEQTTAFRLEQVGNADEIAVLVTGTDVKDAYAYELTLLYDASKLRYKKVESALQGGFTVPPKHDNGTIVLASTKVGSVPGESGEVRFARFVFEPIAVGTAEVTLANVKLVSSALATTTYADDVTLEVSVQSVAAPVVLADIANHWAKPSIERAVALGWVEGYEDGTFRPDGPVTRAEFTAMLARSLGWYASLETSGDGFADAASIPDWADESIAAAVEAGVIQGYEDGTFRPAALITRSEIAVMIARAAGLTAAEERGSLAFADAASIPSWAAPSVGAAVEAGLIRGRGDNRFAPAANTTRAEAVTLLLRLHDAQQP